MNNIKIEVDIDEVNYFKIILNMLFFCSFLRLINHHQQEIKRMEICMKNSFIYF